jgi:branched-chain amino acid transport system ATP-binding protein
LLAGEAVASPLLGVHEVTVTFDGIAALDRISMRVDPGEIVSLIGPNGAGKTTVFNVVCGFVAPDDGYVTFGGARLHRHRPTDLARLGIARTLQGVGLWRGLTVVENVMAGAQSTLRAGLVASALGLPRSSREEERLRGRAMGMLERLDIARHASAHPDELPYGIQKRVALGRALILEPVLLLLDEPAGGLSEGEMGELADLLRAERDRTSVLVVEHHMEFVMSLSDRVVVLNFGEVIASGTPAEVAADPEVTTAYLGNQVAAPEVSP